MRLSALLLSAALLLPTIALAQSRTVLVDPNSQEKGTPGNPLYTGGSNTTAPVPLQYTATASASQLASHALSNGVIFIIQSTNTGTICVGSDNTVTTSTGYCMNVATGITSGSLGVSNTNLIWVIGTNTSDKMMILGN